jgi:RNA polymerase sigma factor (sigma-70 family)
MMCSDANTPSRQASQAENPTRLSLLERLKSWEDQESWRDFFEAYWQLIYDVAIKSGLSDVEAQDVVQETIFSVVKKMPDFQYDPKGSFKSWLLTITFRRIQDEKRKREERFGRISRAMGPSTDTGTVERVADSSTGWESAWDEDWEKNLMAAALDRVQRRADPKHFQAFDLYVSKKWPASKIARTLGIPTASVYVIRHRINKLIKKEAAYLQTKPF